MVDLIGNLLEKFDMSIKYSKYTTEEGTELVQCELYLYTGKYLGFGRDREEAELVALKNMQNFMMDALDAMHGEIRLNEFEDDEEENERLADDLSEDDENEDKRIVN